MGKRIVPYWAQSAPVQQWISTHQHRSDPLLVDGREGRFDILTAASFE